MKKKIAVVMVAIMLISVVSVMIVVSTNANQTTQVITKPTISTGNYEKELKRLPVYKLEDPTISKDEINELAESAFGIEEVEAREINGRYVIEADGKTLDVYKASGGIWFADEKQLWNPDVKPSLPDEKEAREIADSFLREYNLLPSGKEFSVEYLGTSGTQMATWNVENKIRGDRQLDFQVSYGLRISGDEFSLPVTGGGGKFNVVLGDGAKIIGYNGLWRNIEAVKGVFPVIPKEEADEKFKEMTKDLQLVSYESSLAYYSAPSMKKQSYLAPVYIYRGMTIVDDLKIPMRNVYLPATTFRQNIYFSEGGQEIQEGDQEIAKSDTDDATLQTFASTGVTARATSSWREAGTSWIGPSGGLSGSQLNAQGYVNELSADGWTIVFNWGDASAWESDWIANDDEWVDEVDIVFYTGHASESGWTLSPPNDGSLHVSECAPAHTPRDIWGSNDLEWIIIAACGPLEDDIISPGGGDVFRWNVAFDGLHQLLGYGAVTFDNTDEGETVTRYMKEGKTIIDSWFRTAKEIQPSTNGYSPPYGPDIWVGVMYVYESGTTSPYNDHLWGHGSVAPDPVNPNVYVAMWSKT